MTLPVPMIPDSAPFTAAQRAWLNGFLAGLLRGDPGAGTSAAIPSEAEDFPWHDPTLELAERVSLAANRPFERRLMAAMAQLDCGQCGYVCRSYAEALAAGREMSASLCVPGAKPTSKMLKQMLAERPPGPLAAAVTANAATVNARGEPVRVLEAQRLTGSASEKDVRHVCIDLSPSNLVYEPGDSIGIAAINDPALVELCLRAAGAGGRELVPCPDGTIRTMREALTSQLDIARPLDGTFDLFAKAASDPGEAAALRRLANGDDGAEPAEADLLDLLQVFPSARPRPADLVRSLAALKPRLYSIASSLRATPGQVNLCVSVVEVERRGRQRHGVASSFLAHRALEHGEILAHIQSSHFRLPADPAAPVVMVGPGTGIAPFRAFLQDRAALGLKGQTWLFFGAQHERSDFLYEPELKGWLADGTLSRLDTAWSRDQAARVYVQDRIRENSAELWRWLQGGGYFYVCGDAARMAKDVDLALRDVAASEGGLSADAVRDWIANLARHGRYRRDVY